MSLCRTLPVRENGVTREQVQTSPPLYHSWVCTHSTESHNTPHEVTHTCTFTSHTHTHNHCVPVHVRSHAISHSPILSVTHVLSFTHTTSHSYTPLLSTPRLSHSPWVPMASTAKGDPGSVSLPSARIPSSARGLLLPGLLLSAGAGPGGDGSRGRVAAERVAKQAGPRPDAGPLLHSSQNRNSLLLHGPKAGGVLRDVTHATPIPPCPATCQ